jgi:biopolymer transport protein ExbD
MRRRHHYRRRTAEQAELDMTTFLNLMVVLVPFLLLTAVFSRITVVELSMPSSAGGPAVDAPRLRVEVIVREDGLELAEGSSLLARLPKVDDEYDLAGLSEHVFALKRQHPDHDEASVLLEPGIEYDHLIQVMDVVRSAELPASAPSDEAGAAAQDPQPGEGEQLTRVALFTNISIGDAP